MDQRLDFCSPGTVLSTTAANLPGINARVAGIPAGRTGLVPISAFLPGVEYKCSEYAIFPFIPAVERAAAFASGRIDLGPSTEAFPELPYSRVTSSSTADTTVFS